MNEIRNTAALVKEALIDSPKARNSDNYLYFLVCRAKLASVGIDISSISFEDGLLHRSEYELPAFETVRRTRQKIQASCPELAGTVETKAIRAMREAAFRKYARENV